MKNALRNYQKNYDVQRGSRPGQGQGLRVENFSDLKQRVLGNDNPVKLGKCIKELERIHGIQHGNNQHGERIGNDFQSSLTQEELAKELKKNKFQKCFCVYKAPQGIEHKKAQPAHWRAGVHPTPGNFWKNPATHKHLVEIWKGERIVFSLGAKLKGYTRTRCSLKTRQPDNNNRGRPVLCYCNIKTGQKVGYLKIDKRRRKTGNKREF